MRYLDGPAQARALSPRQSVSAIRAALADTLDPELTPPRISSQLPQGEFLLMPAAHGPYVGVKTLGIRADNPPRGFPAVQGVYSLFDADSLRPLAVLDAVELTLMRTTAVTALAGQLLLEHKHAERGSRPVVAAVIGTGPLAQRHAQVISRLGVADKIVILGRNTKRVNGAVSALHGVGADARTGHFRDLATADLIVTATSSTEPLFGVDDVARHAVICAVGAHGADRRELDESLVRDSDIIVEARTAAFRESGNLLAARSASEWEELHPANLKELVLDDLTLRHGRPVIYSGVGMAWQDLVVAAEIYERSSQ